jgi:hypothetical protein
MSAHQRMTARYAGSCLCGLRIRKGDAIAFDRARRRIVGCLSCGMATSSTPRHAPDRHDMMIEDDMARACGVGL